MSRILYVDQLTSPGGRKFGFANRPETIFALLNETSGPEMEEIMEALAENNGVRYIFRAGRFMGWASLSLDQKLSTLTIADLDRENAEKAAESFGGMGELFLQHYYAIQFLSQEESEEFDLRQLNETA